jgi:hypothetical protein
MPRYHFHISENGCLIRDDEGQELLDAASARREALATGTAIARDAFIAGSADHVVIEVREDSSPVVKVSITLDVEEPAR